MITILLAGERAATVASGSTGRSTIAATACGPATSTSGSYSGSEAPSRERSIQLPPVVKAIGVSSTPSGYLVRRYDRGDSGEVRLQQAVGVAAAVDQRDVDVGRHVRRRVHHDAVVDTQPPVRRPGRAAPVCAFGFKQQGQPPAPRARSCRASRSRGWQTAPAGRPRPRCWRWAVSPLPDRGPAHPPGTGSPGARGGHPRSRRECCPRRGRW